MITGSEFVREFASKGLPAWEAATFEIARQDGLTPWPASELTLTDGTNQAILHVQSDVLSIGSVQDHVRLPLTPKMAQNIFNLFGWLLPTPWLVYQIWRNAPIKLLPTPAVPNKGANLQQYAAHSAIIDQQINKAGGEIGQLVAGEKKHVVVSNIYQPGKVLIFGWYKPSPDVFDNGKSMTSVDRQPIQPKSNVHGDFYVDYSHGIQAVAQTAVVNGQVMNTVDLYQHPTLSKLVSNEGPLRYPRYPSSVEPAKNRPSHFTEAQASVTIVPSSPSTADLGLSAIRSKI